MITGAAKRIGKAIALHLASSGYNIVLHYNHSVREAFDLKEELLAMNVEVELLHCDFMLSNIDSLKIKSPSLDLLINNASMFKNDKIEDMTESSLMDHLRVNAVAPILMTKHFVRKSTASDNPSIINILDYDMSDHKNNFISYKISKYMLSHFTNVSAAILAPKVRVNGIAPGHMIKNEIQSEEHFNDAIKSGRLKRAISEKSLLNTLDYLATNKNISGSILSISN